MMNTPTAKISYVFRVRLTGKDEVKIAYVPLEGFKVGSATGLSVSIKDPTIDPEHLSVSIKNNQIMICDLQSARGTWINGRNLAPNVPFPYCPGDKITLGTSDQFLQIHLFVQNIDADLESARILQEAQDRAKKMAHEILANAQDTATKKAEEWVSTTRARLLSVAEQDAETIRIKADQEIKALMAKVQESAVEHKRQSVLDIQSLMNETQAVAKQMEGEADQRARQILNVSEQKAGRIVATAQTEADKLIRLGQEAAEEVKINAHKAYDSEVAQGRERAQQERQNAEARILELLQLANGEAVAAREAGRIEAERVIALARHQGSSELESVRAKAEQLLAQAREAAFDIERTAQESALARSHEAFQSVLSEAESKAIALIQERELRSQQMQEKATRESLAILNSAREEAARVLQEGKLNAVLERSADVQRTLNEAATAAESIRLQARLEAEATLDAARDADMHMRSKVEAEMSALYLESHKKAELIIEHGRSEAVRITEQSQTKAHSLVRHAEEKAREIVAKAEAMVADIERVAREQSHRDGEDQRLRTAHEMFQIREQTQEAYRQAKQFEADRRAEVDKELAVRRAETEIELRNLRSTELSQVDLHWATKRRQDISILMKNLDTSWTTLKIAGQKEQILRNIKDVVEISFAEKQAQKNDGRREWINGIKEKSRYIAGGIGLALLALALSFAFSSNSVDSTRQPASTDLSHNEFETK